MKKECEFPGCSRPSRCRGHCAMHYARFSRHGHFTRVQQSYAPTCSFPGCDSKHYSKGFCKKHCARFRKYGDPSKVHHCRAFVGEHESVSIATVRPSARELAWAAGFIEGEGDFSSTGRAVRATQIEREPLERLLAVFGGRIREGKTPKGKRMYRWEASSWRGRGVAMTIYSMMSTRRKGQIRQMLSAGVR